MDLDTAITLRIPCLVKARAQERGGRRIVEVSASTEAVDADGDIVLQSALINSADNFVRSGHLDIDHYSEFGYQLGIANPSSYIVGKPLEVKALAGQQTSVIGEISRSLDGSFDPQRNRYDEFWDTLQRDPPVLWYSSIFGYPTSFEDCSSNDGACGAMGATRFIIKEIDWRSLAFTRSPKNPALKGAARIITAKSFISLYKAGAPQADGSRERPVLVQAPHHMAIAAERIMQPTPAQAAAGNYRMGHAIIGGLEVTVETPMGGVRRGVGPDGNEWAVRMPVDYGFLKLTRGADDDHVDVYIGPHCHRAGDCPVWVIDQVDSATKDFDEHKILLGFPDSITARQAYLNAFSDGKGTQRIGAVSRMEFNDFTKWLENGDTTKPLRYRNSAGKAMLMEMIVPNPTFPSDMPRVPENMSEVWGARECKNCGVHEFPSLPGYRQHFAKCLGCSPGMADIAAHALMHKANMANNPFTAPMNERPLHTMREPAGGVL